MWRPGYLLVLYIGALVLQCHPNQAQVTVDVTTEGEEVVLPPEDRTVRVGRNVVLRCEINPDVVELLEWFEYISTSVGRKIFSSVDGLLGDPDKYSIQGTYNLVVLNTTVYDGGLYGCLTPGMTVAATASVLVMEKTDTIFVTEMYEGLNYSLECSVLFGSQPPDSLNPSQKPYIQGFIGNSKLPDYTETIVEDGENRYTLIEHFPYTAADTDHDEPIDCIVYSNTSAYKDISRRFLNVLFSVRDLTVSPRNQVYPVGDKADCSARGNPSPTYVWYPVSSRVARCIEGQTLDMSREMIGENLWRCEADQTLNGTEYRVNGLLGIFYVENSTCSPGRVMFTAYLTLDKAFEHLEIITYNVVVTNCGGNYNPETGIFTCPKSGYYQFFLNVKSELSSEIVDVDVERDGSFLFRAYSPYNSGSGADFAVPGSNSMIVYCNQGSQVWAIQPIDRAPDRYYTHNMFNTFSGLLLT